MKKTVAIASYSKGAVSIYREQIKSIFGDALQIEELLIENLASSGEIRVDVLLTPSYDSYNEIEKHLINQTKILFVNRTISQEGYEKINALSAGIMAYLLDETLEMSKNMISTMIQLGLTHIKWIPINRQILSDLKNETIIVLGSSHPLMDNDNKVIDVGNSLMDIATLMDIASSVDLDEMTRPVNLRTVYRDLVSANIGMTNLIKRANTFDVQNDLLFDAADFGAVVLDSEGAIVSCNNSASEILKRDGQELLNLSGVELFPQLPIKKILNDKTVVEEELIQISGYDVVISAEAIKHSNRLYGVVVILKKFSDSEKKQHKIRARLLGKGHQARYQFEDIIGKSDVMIKCKEIASRMSMSDSSVLIMGETGTGKEFFAQAIHNHSNRHRYQFVAVNCGAFPESLLESELFGYEEGAFTGARKGGKPGLFELAHKGTLFLDEIGEMPLRIQTRLLRVLQEREVMRVGGDTLIHVDMRIIAATNNNLKEMVEEGSFREDLYYRMNVLPITIPPLRDRVEDILLLSEQFEKEFNVSLNFSNEVKSLLKYHHWKGNVRELRNYVEYMVNLGLKSIEIDDLPGELQSIQFRPDYKRPIGMIDSIDGLDHERSDYLFLLEQLDISRRSGRRIGRRSLSEKAKERGVFLSEKEIRRMLLELEERSLVSITKGRGGTIITDSGQELLAK